MRLIRNKYMQKRTSPIVRRRNEKKNEEEEEEDKKKIGKENLKISRFAIEKKKPSAA